MWLLAEFIFSLKFPMSDLCDELGALTSKEIILKVKYFLCKINAVLVKDHTQQTTGKSITRQDKMAKSEICRHIPRNNKTSLVD